MDDIANFTYGKSNREFRIFRNPAKFELQEKIKGHWSRSAADYDRIMNDMQMDIDDIYKLSIILGSIPNPYHNAVKKQSARKYTLLSMLHFQPKLIDVCNSVPLLSAVYADEYAKKRIRPESVLENEGDVSLIAHACNIYHVDKTISVLKQVACNNIDDKVIRESKRFARNCNNFRNRFCKTLPEIDFDFLVLFNRCSSLFSFSIYEYSILHNIYEHVQLLKDYLVSLSDEFRHTKLIADYLGIPSFEENSKRCNCLSAFYELSNKIIKGAQINNSIKFSKPPVKSSEFIKPIITSKGLYEEGMSQKNCIFNYLPEIINGNFYVYQVLKPERATLGININNGFYSIDDLKLYYNAEPSIETWDFVRDWLNANVS